MYTCMYVCMYVCMYMYACMYLCMCVSVCFPTNRVRFYFSNGERKQNILFGPPKFGMKFCATLSWWVSILKI